MNYTPNYSMKLPGYGDNADIADLNENTTTIDSLIHDNRTMIAQAYSQLESYVVGDIVENEGKLYRCIGATSGNWDATKWTRTTLGDEVEEAGASALADLDDVSLTTPTEGQILTYDGDDWVNADAPDVDVTKTVEGNPIEISDGANAPLVKCVTEIQGSQDLHGYDKPWVGGAGKNKLEVTATSQTINGVTFTVNSDGTVVANGTASAEADFILCGVISLQGSFILNGCPSNGSTDTFFINAQTTSLSWNNKDTGSGITINDTITRVAITVLGGVTVSNLLFKPMIRLSTESDPTFQPYSNICPITAYTENTISVVGKNRVKQVVQGYVNKSTGLIKIDNDTETVLFYANEGDTYTVSAGDSLDRSIVGYVGVDTLVNGTPVSNITDLVQVRTWTATWTGWTAWYIRASISTVVEQTAQVEKGTTATTYEPYTSTTHTTTYPAEIYRGSEDVVKGEVTKEWAIATLDGSESWNRHSFSTESLNAFYTTFNGGQKSYPDGQMGVFNEFATGVVGSTGANGNAFVGPTTVQIRLDAFNNVADLKTYLSTHPIVFAYELATPTTSSVTPTNLPIKSLSGYNHIESSTGDMEIEYIAKNFSPITELVDSQISALQKMMELMLTSARETTMTASTNYTAGTLIVACGALYKATTAISSGASLVVGTNITPTTIAAEIAALA